MTSSQPYVIDNGKRQNVKIIADSIELSDGTTAQTAIESLMRVYRKANTAYAKDDVSYAAELPAGFYLECTTAGTTGSTLPSFANVDEGDIITDGTVTWLVKRLGGNVTAQDISTANATYPILLGATANATANIGNKATLFSAKAKLNPSTAQMTLNNKVVPVVSSFDSSTGTLHLVSSGS